MKFKIDENLKVTIVTELLLIHPFREGNGRIARQLAAKNLLWKMFSTVLITKAWPTGDTVTVGKGI